MENIISERQFRKLVEKFVEEQGNSEKQAARLIGVSHKQLSDFLSGHSGAGVQIAVYFGFAPVYERLEEDI